jgi:hypothetical protein
MFVKYFQSTTKILKHLSYTKSTENKNTILWREKCLQNINRDTLYIMIFEVKIKLGE